MSGDYRGLFYAYVTPTDRYVPTFVETHRFPWGIEIYSYGHTDIDEARWGELFADIPTTLWTLEMTREDTDE